MDSRHIRRHTEVKIMDTLEKLKEIEEYFENLTVEEFEENLKKAGHGVIEPSSKSGFELV